MPVAALDHPAVTAALATAANLLGMEVVFIGELTEEEFGFSRLYGSMPGLAEGMRLPRADSFCHRLVSGAPATTADAEHDPAYADAPVRAALGIRSYVGVPVRNAAGDVVGTLCGIDRGSITVSDDVLSVMRSLAGVIEAHLGDVPAAHELGGPNGLGGIVLRRTPSGWRVGADDEEDGGLTSAMVLADLLAEDLEPASRPPRGEVAEGELDRLRLAVAQLEHALTARVTVEQAIGILAERQRLAPRAAFERLRKAARSRGRKVHELARQVVASVSDPAAPLPPELAGRR